MAAKHVQQYRISAKNATTVTLVPVLQSNGSLRDTGRNITQIVITSDALADHTQEKYFSNVDRLFTLTFEKTGARKG